MKRLSKLVAVALALLTYTNADAQVSVHIDSLLFENSHRIDSASCGELRLNFDALCFFRDNESIREASRRDTRCLATACSPR